MLIRLEQNIFPWIGKRPIMEVTTPELLSALRRVESEAQLKLHIESYKFVGKYFVMALHRTRWTRPVSRFTWRTGTRQKHHASITDPVEVGKLLRAINTMKASLSLNAHYSSPSFLRPGELRQPNGANWFWKSRMAHSSRKMKCENNISFHFAHKQ